MNPLNEVLYDVKLSFPNLIRLEFTFLAVPARVC